MIVGDIHIATCPFEDRTGAKERPVVILQELEDGVAIIESRSKSKGNLQLALKIDFSADKRYKSFHLSGTSHFYIENFKVVPKTSIMHRLGSIHESDLIAMAKILGFPPESALPRKNSGGN